MMHLEAHASEAMLVDGWLPDLEAREFAAYVRLLYPEMDLLWLDGGLGEERREGLDQGLAARGEVSCCTRCGRRESRSRRVRAMERRSLTEARGCAARRRTGSLRMGR